MIRATLVGLVRRNMIPKPPEMGEQACIEFQLK